MVDWQRVLGELKRTAYVGVGTFGSATVGELLDDFAPGGDLGVSIGQIVVGAGAAAASDRVLGDQMSGPDTTSGLDFDASEAARHVGYGVGGAGFAELADVIQGETGAGARSGSDRTITVETSANADDQTGQQAQDAEEEFEVQI